MMSFFPQDVLDEIWDLIEAVSEDFPTYSLLSLKAGYGICISFDQYRSSSSRILLPVRTSEMLIFL